MKSEDGDGDAKYCLSQYRDIRLKALKEKTAGGT
jgi:hypothetical protein